MKKIVTAMLAICCFISANAQRQQALQGTKFLDNWSIGLNGGVTQPLAHPYSLGENIRPTVGVEIYKQLLFKHVIVLLYLLVHLLQC